MILFCFDSFFYSFFGRLFDSFFYAFFHSFFSSLFYSFFILSFVLLLCSSAPYLQGVLAFFWVFFFGLLLLLRCSFSSALFFFFDLRSIRSSSSEIHSGLALERRRSAPDLDPQID
eukprot:GEMP01079928.1.p1 GENE.GEMP01079928.1~~GEMP01079928.1.p1  ORF type:complete len:116 (-),score=0.81 GEMP01079928.1:505-852(-)